MPFIKSEEQIIIEEAVRRASPRIGHNPLSNARGGGFHGIEGSATTAIEDGDTFKDAHPFIWGVDSWGDEAALLQ